MRSGKGVLFDTAGKYGAGLALEVLGKCLRKLNIRPQDVTISNKLGWVRTPLLTEEPTFEPGVWKDLKYDAEQKISYDGILECFEQGNELLNGYMPQLVSVHDPDEYLASSLDASQAADRYRDILQAYEALFQLKQQGKVKAVGVGAKDWKLIRRIAADVPLDWAMIANSMTIKSHPVELLDFIHELDLKGVAVINSAVFHSGFLVGGNYFDYRLVGRGIPENDSLYRWREQFFEICDKHGVAPAAACVKFSLNIPGVRSVALNTTNARRVSENLTMAEVELPLEFWQALRSAGLIKMDIQSRLPAGLK